MAAISSANTRLPCRLWVTSPAAMRCASASANALLPTPGSPSRQGLFFWRRHRISTTRSSSVSRQSTGSSCPSCARRVRSRPYFSLGRLPRLTAMWGVRGSTICPESWRHSRAACGTSTPSSVSQTLAVQLPSSSMAQSRCSFSALAAWAAWAPRMANSMALRVSGARSFRCSRRIRPVQLRRAAHSSSADSVTCLRRRNSTATPRPVCSMATKRWPVSAAVQPCRPAMVSAMPSVLAAVREKPLKQYSIRFPSCAIQTASLSV